MGCGHFIIGRDHAELVLYNPEDNYKLLENLGDIGIKPIFGELVTHQSKEFGKVGELRKS